MSNMSRTPSLKRNTLRKIFKSILNLNPSKSGVADLFDGSEYRPLPYLPAELWILIIRHATAIYPDPLDTSRAISFIDPPNSEIRHSQYRSSMRQKLNLTLVNKFWNKFAQEFLYEFVWISCSTDAEMLAETLAQQAESKQGRVQHGNYIRRLHIQTSTLDRCNPAHLRTILDFSPHLIVYSDYRSVRRNLLEESCNPGSSPEAIFKALAHPKNSLRRLSWTNYDDVAFHLRMTPMIEATAANLEFLELNFCSSHLHSMFNNTIPTPSSSTITLNLPALRTLKVTLDNATFTVLAAWTLPVLENLSVLSADFSYAGPGFSEFFMVHGSKLNQLELGHSSSMIEEHYLTTPPQGNPQHHHHQIPLAAWCPNLSEFICSADAEWNWENPDWIAPHVLLPTHPNVKFIGIRDIDKRLRDDIAFARENNYANDDNLEDDSPFFSLLEQIHSLLRSAAFPSLKFIRDLSGESDRMRRRDTEIRVLKFWKRVLTKCKERTVWLEDCDGFNVTANDLLRFEKRKYGFLRRDDLGT
ncbi:hypothetical protein C8J56DRAFT_937123 [Mycena floridula]|nr:hypothetical protein C8J56DRAFT_937123 [Mycena floridula]